MIKTMYQGMAAVLTVLLSKDLLVLAMIDQFVKQFAEMALKLLDMNNVTMETLMTILVVFQIVLGQYTDGIVQEEIILKLILALKYVAMVF